MDLRRLAASCLTLPIAVSCAGSRSPTTASPPASSGAGAAISAAGKLAKGAEGTCRVLHGDDGKDYSFVSSSIDSNFRDGDHVCVTGSPAMGFCMQGTQLEPQAMERCR